MAGKGGGAWKVAYADFVTAMMAFFMVMWLTSQKPEVKQAIAGYFRDPYAIFHGNDTGAAADAAPTEDPKLGHAAESQRRRVSNSGDDANYQFAVLFPEGVAELDAAARESIGSFAPTMVGKLNRVEVRAHCQRMPLPEDSEFKDRWDLCYARGRAVQSELETHGIDADRIRLSQAEANEPIATNLTQEEQKLNSRVDVILLDDLVDAPWDLTPTADEEHAEVEAATDADEHGGHADAPAHGEPSHDEHAPAGPAHEAHPAESPAHGDNAAEPPAEHAPSADEHHEPAAAPSHAVDGHGH